MTPDAAAIRKALHAADKAGPIVRAEFPIRGDVDPTAWLAARESDVKVYWADRRHRLECAGAGVAAWFGSTPEHVEGLHAGGCVFQHVEGWEGVFKKARGLSGHPHLRCFGGMAFDRDASPAEEWKAFGHSQFVVPRYELFRTGAQWRFACNWPADQLDSVDAELGALDGPPVEGLPAVESQQTEMNRAAWITAVQAVLDEIGRGTLEKAVLARRAKYRFQAPLDPVQILRRLRARGNGTYVFYFQPRPNTAFISASPEQFAAGHENAVESEALAGTRPRGVSEDSDAAYADDLLHDEKELREHGAVVNAVRDVFASFCSRSQMEHALSLVRLQDCQHIVRRMRGRLREGRAPAAFLEALHPTPAVGGVPRAAAMTFIRRLEPFSRGWYAGPVGWIGQDAFEFAVGIRSAMVEERAVSLYAGAGIVAGSDPAREWDEVETKMQALARLVRPRDDMP